MLGPTRATEDSALRRVTEEAGAEAETAVAAEVRDSRRVHMDVDAAAAAAAAAAWVLVGCRGRAAFELSEVEETACAVERTGLPIHRGARRGTEGADAAAARDEDAIAARRYVYTGRSGRKRNSLHPRSFAWNLHFL
jgi:hypothetical protein